MQEQSLSIAAPNALALFFYFSWSTDLVLKSFIPVGLSSGGGRKFSTALRGFHLFKQLRAHGPQTTESVSRPLRLTLDRSTAVGAQAPSQTGSEPRSESESDRNVAGRRATAPNTILV